MTKREAERRTMQADTLRGLGFTSHEATALRRISLTLQRWYERECGSSDAYSSIAIERDGENGDGRPFLVRQYHQGPNRVQRYPIPDRERGALRRLSKIVDTRNGRAEIRRAEYGPEPGAHAEPFDYYVQGDPRGAALYILRPGDVPAGQDPGAYYTRGICVY